MSLLSLGPLPAVVELSDASRRNGARLWEKNDQAVRATAGFRTIPVTGFKATVRRSSCPDRPQCRIGPAGTTRKGSTVSYSKKPLKSGKKRSS
jgi:hypothetical protein